MTTLARWYVFPVWQTMSQWQGVSLMLMPAALASGILLCATAILAAMVSDTVGKAIVDRYGAKVALFTDSIVAPRVQELARHLTLSDRKKEELDGLFSPVVIGRPIIAFRIWIDDQIIYSNNREMIGRRFSLSPARARAWEGGVSTELNQLDGDDEVPIRALGVHILEVYAPLRQAGTGQIVALVETYDVATELYYEVRAAQALVWLIFGATAIGFISLLFILIGRGASEISRINAEKSAFRMRVGRANRRISDMNELHMRRLGTDLSKGPAQLVGVALLKLEALRALVAEMGAPADPNSEDFGAIKQALTEALDEIRNLSESLVPSQLYELSLADTIATAVRRHERRTGASITCELANLPPEVPFSVKACFYRFVREALAKGDQTDARTVRVDCDGDMLRVEVKCTIAAQQLPPSQQGQWLRTLQDRIDSIGGKVLVQAWPNVISYTAQFKVS
jgi:signal transduction histidine kinase